MQRKNFSRAKRSCDANERSSSFSFSRSSSGASSSRGPSRFSRGRSSDRVSKSRHGSYIEPHKFINKAISKKAEAPYVSKHTFHDFGLAPALISNLEKRGYKTPTPIQDGAIPHVLQGKDVIGLANTGSGKTAAFLLPSMHHLKGTKNTVLIMAPTRELAGQIDKELKAFATGLPIYSALCVGGMSMYRQKVDLSHNPHFVIGTPGRLKDLYKQGVLNLDKTTVFVLDEVDRMLDMGFIKDIQFIIDQLPEQRQSLCFSATMNPEIKRLLDHMLKSPVLVSVRTSETGEHIEQDIIRAKSKEEKLAVLVDLLGQPEFSKVLVFGETKWGVQKLSEYLTAQGLPAESIHGNKSQPQRQKSLDAFKYDKIKILVATDVAARGLDIPNVSHVINFDQPYTYEDYIHRIGRTGRAGNKGKALTFINVY